MFPCRFGAVERPEGSPPIPWWSPKPTTVEEYIYVLSKGNEEYRKWAEWLKLHPEEVPEDYFKTSKITLEQPPIGIYETTPEITPEVTPEVTPMLAGLTGSKLLLFAGISMILFQFFRKRK